MHKLQPFEILHSLLSEKCSLYSPISLQTTHRSYQEPIKSSIQNEFIINCQWSQCQLSRKYNKKSSLQFQNNSSSFYCSNLFSNLQISAQNFRQKKNSYFKNQEEQIGKNQNKQVKRFKTIVSSKGSTNKCRLNENRHIYRYNIQIQMEKMASAANRELLQTVAAKEEWSGNSKWLQRLNFSFGMFSIIYLTITNSIVQTSNIIFANIRAFDAQLHTEKSPFQAMVWIFFSFTLKSALLGIAVLLVRLLQEEHSDRWLATSKNIRKYLAGWLAIYEILMVPISVFAFRYADRSLQPALFLAFLLSAAIIYAFQIKIIYGFCYFGVIGVVWLVDARMSPLCLFALNVLLFVRNDSCRPYLLLAIVYDLIIFAIADLRIDISFLHLLVITAAILTLSLSLPSLSPPAGEGLLAAVAKLHDGEVLSTAEEWEIYRMAYHVQAEAKRHNFSIDKQKVIKLQSLQESVTKQGLCVLLKLYISLSKLIAPPSLLPDIQISEAELYCSEFSIQVLTHIEKVSREVEERGDLGEKLRMMKLRHQLKGKLLASNEKLSKISIIIQAEKCREAFKRKIDHLLELYLAFWGVTSVRQEQMMKKIDRICDLEKQCCDLLSSLGQWQQGKLESRLFNHIQSRLNNSTQDAFPVAQLAKEIEDFGETRYILVDKDIIVDLSEELANSIQIKKSFLVGSGMLAVIPTELRQFYSENLNEWLISTSQVNIPLASKQDANIFFPFQCTFRILPEIEHGFRYFINVQSSFRKKQEIYMLYSSVEDRIIKISGSFGGGPASYGFVSEELLSIDFSFLGNYCKQQQSSERILCEISLKNGGKKSSSKRCSTNNFQILKLLEIYQTKTDQLYLLSITNKGEEVLTEVSITKKSIREMPSNDNTFCPIKNPFEELIDERLNERHTHFFRITYMRTIFVIFLIVICLGLGTFLEFYGTVKNSISTLSEQINNLASHIGNQEEIFLLFYQYYIYIHAVKQPQDFVLPNSKLNTVKLQVQYMSKVTKYLNALLILAVDSNVVLNPNPYKMIYSNFQTNGKADSITLLPLLEGIQTSIKSQDFTFVLQNVKIVDLFMNSIKPIDTNILHQIEQHQKFLLLTAVVGILAAVFFVKIQYMRIKITSWSILDLYDKISKDQARTQLTLISKFRQEVGGPTRQYEEEVKKESQCYKMRNTKEINSQFTQPIKKAKFCSIILKENLILLMIVAIWAIFYYYCFSQLNNYKADIKMITDYSTQIQLMSRANTADSELFYRAAMQDLLPTAHRTNWNFASSVSFPNFRPISSVLPPNFDLFSSSQSNKLTQSMCSQPGVQSAIQKDLFLATMNCSSVLKGVLAKGFDEAFPYYIHMLRFHIGTQLSDLNLTYEKNSVYPFFAEVIYCRRAMDVIINNLSQAFNMEISSFLRIKQVDITQLVGLAMLVLVSVSMLMGIYLNKMRKLCKITKKSFNLFPKNLIYNIKISKIITEGPFLNQVQSLSP